MNDRDRKGQLGSLDGIQRHACRDVVCRCAKRAITLRRSATIALPILIGCGGQHAAAPGSKPEPQGVQVAAVRPASGNAAHPDAGTAGGSSVGAATQETLATGAGVPPSLADCDRYAPCLTKEVNIPALPANLRKTVYTGTGISVRKNACLTIQAVGSWYVGTRSPQLDANGIPDRCACVVRDYSVQEAPPGASDFTLHEHHIARLGALVGRLGDGMPFFVGAKLKMLAVEDGELQLTINDNMDPCLGSGPYRGSCFVGNTGRLTVTVEVREPKCSASHE